MLKAIDLMNTDLVPVHPDDSVEDAMYEMLRHQLSSLPVVDASNRLLGIISELDLLDLAQDPQTDRRKVSHWMNRKVHSVDEDTELSAVARAFRTHAVRRLPVMRGKQLVGMIGRQDVLAHILRSREQVVPAPICVTNPIGMTQQVVAH